MATRAFLDTGTGRRSIPKGERGRSITDQVDVGPTFAAQQRRRAPTDTLEGPGDRGARSA